MNREVALPPIPTERTNVMDQDEEKFTCAYSECGREVEKFPFKNELDQKFCSSVCRRKAEEERKDAHKADRPYPVPRSA